MLHFYTCRMYRPALAVLLALSSAPAILAQTTSIQAGLLQAKVVIEGGRLRGLTIHDAVSGHDLALRQAFVLVMKDKSELRSSDMQVTQIAEGSNVVDPHESLRRSTPRSTTKSTNQSAHKSRCWQFIASGRPISLAWCLAVRPDTDYLRELLRISAAGTDLAIAEVRMLQFTDARARVDGVVKGSPVTDGNLFFALEHPLSANSVHGDEVHASLMRDLPLRTGQSITYSAVVGTSRNGQLRRAFLTYIEEERPRAYEPFLHYNSWYDLGYENRFDETGALDRIDQFGKHMVEERKVKLDSFLFDDGWDDPNTLWGFNSGFPDGFTRTGEAAARYHAGIGVWLSPWGGYAEQKQQRIAYGKAHGFEIQNDGYALSGPRYFNQFERICLDMVNNYHVNQFKFDGTGNADGVFPGSAFDSDFDAAIHLIERLRKQEPDLFVNLTTGTTASPFWLFYADSIWRGGEDHDFSGVGDARQRWITYRDAQTYKNIVLQGPLFPLNSLMLHGIIYAKQAKDLMNDPGDDFADEVHSYFGSGTQLQEMYITPALLTTANWNTLADAARWSRNHAQTLKDTHWLGGDPDKLEVYGWAAWTPTLGIVTLRNPSTKSQTYELDLRKAFEQPGQTPAAYTLHNVWNAGDKSAFSQPHPVQDDVPLSIKLAPFEVLTIEAHPTS